MKNTIPETDRPRERFIRHGPEALKTAELIAIILGSGTKETPVLLLSQAIVTKFGDLKGLAEATIEEFCQIKGMGPAKAIQLCAALTLGIRASQNLPQAKSLIQTPAQAYETLRSLFAHEKRELFVALLLDTRANLINHQIISIGTLSNTLVHPRELFYPAIRHKAASIIIAHNHPSGDPTPSREDLALTKTLLEAAALMDIPINDHLIITDTGYLSFRQEHLM